MNGPRALMDLAESQLGLVSRAQLREMGYSAKATSRMFTSPHWTPITSQVLRRGGTPVGNGTRLLAAVLDAGEAVAISHRTAGRWWGLFGCRLDPITVTTTGRSRRATELATTHHVRSLPPQWCAVLRCVPVVRPELLALQLFAACPEAQAERHVERLWSMRLLSGASIARFLSEMGASGRNGTAGLRRYLEPRGLDYTPHATNIETRFMQLMRSVDIPMRQQVDSGGLEWTGRVDFRHVSHPLIVEVQSGAFHLALVDRRADARRVKRLTEDGFVVVEVWDTEVWADPTAAINRVRDALATLP